MTIKESLIYGTLLGDGSLSLDKTTYVLAISHNVNQLHYLQWKARVLDHKASIQNRTSGFGSDMYSIHYYNRDLLESIYETCIGKNRRRKVTKKWISYLDDLSLAVWYQDDGNWAKCGQKKNGKYVERYVRFSTCSEDDESIRLLCKWLASMGIDSRPKWYAGYQYIVLGQIATVKLWERVAPYILVKEKIDTNIKPGLSWCTCGTPLRQCETNCDQCLYAKAIARPAGTNSRNHAGHDNLAKILIRRFGTSSKQKLIGDKPVFSIPSAYWIDNNSIGSRLVGDLK